jgi:hypothetical protein
VEVAQACRDSLSVLKLCHSAVIQNAWNGPDNAVEELMLTITKLAVCCLVGEVLAVNVVIYVIASLS